MTNWGCPIPPALWEGYSTCPDRNMEGSLGHDLSAPIYKQPWNKSRRKQDLFIFPDASSAQLGVQKPRVPSEFQVQGPQGIAGQK